MVERILGEHYIYHTKFAEYDGFRPPLHDPAIVIGRWLYNDNRYWFNQEQINLYRSLYPNNSIHFPCSCALEASEEYHKAWGN